MTRALEVIANATPANYLLFAPRDPVSVAMTAIGIAQRKWPIVNRDDGVERVQNYEILYVGPGAGLVIQAGLQQGHTFFGLETSKRGIRSAPDEVRSYVLWSLPWETPFTTRSAMTESGHQTFRPMFHVVVVNKYLAELLNPEEWSLMIAEMKKIGRYVILFNPN